MPKRGGRFRIGCATGATPDTLDPRTFKTTMPIGINLQLRNYLVEVDHTGTAIPELAKCWEPSSDAKIWVFNIRKGVEFHNGKSVRRCTLIFKK